MLFKVVFEHREKNIRLASLGIVTTCEVFFKFFFLKIMVCLRRCEVKRVIVERSDSKTKTINTHVFLLSNRNESVHSGIRNIDVRSLFDCDMNIVYI